MGAINMFTDNKDSHFLKPVVDFFPAPVLFCNIPELRAVEIPSGGMLSNARSMAKVNACMANGGKLGNVRIMSEETCADSMAFWITNFDPEVNASIPFCQGGFGDVGRSE